MAIESKYTSPLPLTVAQALAAKPPARPSAIGTSRLTRRSRSAWRAPAKNGAQENSITGAVISRLAQRISPSACGVSAPSSM